MSDSANERSEDLVGGGSGNGNGNGSGNDGGDDGRGNPRKAKRVSLFRFRRKRKKRAANPPSSSSSAVCSGKRVGGGGGGGGGRGGGGGGGFCCCFRQTPTLDSPVEPQTSDPNSPEFTYGLLRALVEKNDFYSKECNTHFDI